MLYSMKLRIIWGYEYFSRNMLGECSTMQGEIKYRSGSSYILCITP
jgi:hypothetical protein